ncbi:MAG: hypothetical protein K6U14_06470 [Firmicutes bacterium]|nr:hypothetical protein [Alicyclobacillaceae bacterium]MCL6497264.1 hypothetical protein [Bacillota bacterium]
MAQRVGFDDGETMTGLAQLVAEQESLRRRQATLGLRPLTPGLRWTLWGLRIYVLLMVAMVAWEAVTAH